MLTGAGRLDRRIERQQIRLITDVIDDLDDAANPLAVLAQAQHAFGNLLYLPAQHLHPGYGRPDIFRAGFTGAVGLLSTPLHHAGIVHDLPGGDGNLCGGRCQLLHGCCLLTRRRGLLHRNGGKGAG